MLGVPSGKELKWLFFHQSPCCGLKANEVEIGGTRNDPRFLETRISIL